MDLKSMFEELERSPDLTPFRDLIEPLETYDREHNSDLIRTLRAFFAANANASEAADRLYLHRNSLPYRLSRIGELTGLDLKNHQARLALQLGLLAATAEATAEATIEAKAERSTDDEDERP